MIHQKEKAFTERGRIGQAEALIARNPLLVQAFTLEPALKGILRRMTSFIEIAQPHQAYSRFKEEFSRYVGWYAQKETLRTPGHYEAMLDLVALVLDWVAEYPVDADELEFGDDGYGDDKEGE